MERKLSASMTEGVIWKAMVLFCIPLLFGNFFQQLYSTVDSIVVGKVVGKEALAAIGACDPIIALVLNLCAGASAGAGVVISQLFGAQREKDLKTAVHTTISIAFVLGLVLEIIGLLLVPSLMKWIQMPEDVIAPGTTYMRVYFAGLLFTVLFNMTSGILNAVGNSRRSLLYLIIASAVNIVLDLIFVMVFRWGIFGAAFATVLSQLLSCVCSITYLCRCKEQIYGVDLKQLRINKASAARILSIGVPSSIQGVVRCLANIFVQTGINSFGSDAVAGYSAYLRVDGFMWMPLMSIGIAASTFTGQNIGAGKFGRVDDGLKLAIKVSAFYSVTAGFLIMLTANPIISIFNSEPGVVQYGVISIIMFMPFYWLFAIYNTMAGALTGAGRTVIAMLSSVGAFCIFRILWMVLLKATGFVPYTFTSLIAMYPASWILSLAILVIYMKKVNWTGQKAERLE